MQTITNKYNGFLSSNVIALLFVSCPVFFDLINTVLPELTFKTCVFKSLSECE